MRDNTVAVFIKSPGVCNCGLCLPFVSHDEMPVTGGGFYFPRAGSLDCVSLHISPGIDDRDKQGL